MMYLEYKRHCPLSLSLLEELRVLSLPLPLQRERERCTFSVSLPHFSLHDLLILSTKTYNSSNFSAISHNCCLIGGCRIKRRLNCIISYTPKWYNTGDNVVRSLKYLYRISCQPFYSASLHCC